MFVTHRFHLNQYTKDLINDMEPKFGYDGFGEFIFYRTYSRITKEGKQENWADVVIRVIEGTFSIRKDWYLKTGISWDEKYWQELARNMAVSMFNMEWLPPGRGLWAMGTNFIYERGGMALYNCAYSDIWFETLDTDSSWTMDCLMQGVGTGFGPHREDNYKFKNPKGLEEFVIPDSREGWTGGWQKLLQAYMYGKPKPKYVYDEIRPAGLLIKGFGGISSGPEPLKRLYEWTEEAIERYMVDKSYDSVIFKTDLENQAGCMTISGNVRRCLPGGVWISTTNGLIKIKDLEPYHRVQTLNGYKGIKNIFKQGTQKLISVILENEREFRCTPNHKFAVLESIHGDIEWVEAQYLDENDYVLLSHIPCDGNNHYDVETAYFYGVLNGDGHVRYNPSYGTQTSICFSNDEIGNRSCNKIINYLNSVGVNYYERFSNNSIKYYHLAIYGTEFAKTCLPYKTPKKSPIIPEAIYSASPKARAAYLAGLCDADGTASKYNLCSSKWKSFLQQVQIIASSLGIDTYIHTRPERMLKATGKTYAKENLLIIKGFASKRQACKLINPYMCKQFPRRDSTRYDNNIPFGFLEKALKERKLFQEEYNDLSIQCRRKNGISNLIHKQLIDFYPEFWEKVIPCKVQQVIDFEEEEETYDIEVEEDHCFFAEGVLVHNSAESTQGPISDPVFMDLKNYDRFPERKAWGWMSNNSVSLESNEDFERLPEIAKRIVVNGEPGVINLRNFPYGRIGRRKEKLIKDTGRNCNPCFEIILQNKEVCNISETCPTICNNPEKWLMACEYATLYCSTVSLLPTNQSSTNKVVAKNRRIGVSIIDFTGWVSDIGLSNVTKFLRKGYKQVRKTNKLVNAEAGVPEAIRVTTVKPGGTVPKLVGKTSGSMYPNFHYMIRRVRVACNSSIHQLLTDANVPYENDLVSANTDVFEFPVKMNINVPEAGEVSVWQQAMNLVTLQREWADNAVSNTLNFRPKWVLIRHYQEGDIEKELAKFFYDSDYQPDILASIYSQLSEKDEYENNNYRITVKWDNNYTEMIETKIYQFDPRHEENSIEAVLAAIAPVTKTISMIPHTAKGVYSQMPEEGITEEEYNQRLSLIKKIDWSKLKGSEGIDEKYCSGESCERV